MPLARRPFSFGFAVQNNKEGQLQIDYNKGEAHAGMIYARRRAAGASSAYRGEQAGACRVMRRPNRRSTSKISRNFLWRGCGDLSVHPRSQALTGSEHY
jgi:hypothetical protein